MMPRAAKPTRVIVTNFLLLNMVCPSYRFAKTTFRRDSAFRALFGRGATNRRNFDADQALRLLKVKAAGARNT
jgi:hypothetical protein